VSDFLLKQVAGLKAKGYKEAPGFAAAGIKAGKTYMHDGSYYSGYVVTFKFKGVPGEFVALTESGIRGHANLYGPWNAEPGEVSNWQNSVAGKSLAIGERRPGITDEDYTDEDLISVVIAKTPLLYKK
jgi:hypothetical protein